jgi:hypothetical protein
VSTGSDNGSLLGRSAGIMNTTTDRQDIERSIRRWSGWGLGLLFPMVALSFVPALAGVVRLKSRA